MLIFVNKELSEMLLFNSLEDIMLFIVGVRGGVVGSGTALQSGRSRVRLRIWSLGYFID
jgi:hypothetical protein